MANRFIKKGIAYGINNPLQALSPQPVISGRNPTANDINYPLATIWANTATDAYFVLTSIAAGQAVWTAQATGSGTFASVDITGGVGTVLTVQPAGNTELGGDLEVTGNTTMTGNLTVNGDTIINGDFDISSSSAISFTSTADQDPSISFITNGGTAETMLLSVVQGTDIDSLRLESAVGGILLFAANETDPEAIHLNAPNGGYTLDAGVTSAINVTGAGADLQLNATGGSIIATATESTAGAVSLVASGAAGTVVVQGTGGVSVVGTGGVTVTTTNSAISVQPGTGAVNISTAAAQNTTTIGNNTGASIVAINAGTGGAGAINIGTTANDVPVNIASGTGASTVTIASGTGGVFIGANAVQHDVTIGSATGTSGVFIQGGTGGVDIGANAVAQPVVIGNNTGATSVSIQAGTAGAGAINIGTTANAVPITMGNATGATSVAISSGSGGTDILSAGGIEIDAGLIEIANGPAASNIIVGNDAVGTQIQFIVPAGDGVDFSNGADNARIVVGTGSPDTAVTAPQGSLYLRVDGSSTSTRLYVNTDGATAWTNFVSAA